MERIGNSNYGRIYETLALSAIRQANIPTERLHADTTTISFYGEYDVDLSVLDEAEREECIAIERGYNKDGRPQCNQVVVGEIVNEEGIPISSRTMSGSTADTDWNAKAVSYLKQLQEQGFQYGIFVADSKLGARYLMDVYPPQDFLGAYREDKRIAQLLKGKTKEEKGRMLKSIMGYENEEERPAPAVEEIKDHVRKLEYELFYLWEYVCSESLRSEAKEYIEDHEDDPIPFGYPD